MTRPQERPVVVGMAASTWLGDGVERLFARLGEGLGANGREASQPRRFPPLEHDISRHLRKTRAEDRLTKHILAAIDLDLSPMLGSLTDADRARTAIALGNTSGNFEPYCEFYETGSRAGYAHVNPARFPTTMLNYQAVQISNAFALSGANATIGSGCSAGLDAIAYAARRLVLGKETFALAGGAEGLNSYNLALLRRRTGEAVPERVARDNDRTAAAEGIALLYLERRAIEGTSDARGLAAILGHGSSRCEKGEGAVAMKRRAIQALEEAISSSGLRADDIDAVFPSADGRVSGDAIEIDVLKAVFGNRLRELPLYPVKGIIGECFTASGPLQCIAALWAMHHGPKCPSGKRARPAGGAQHLRLPDRLAQCDRVLVYSIGPDHTLAALVLERLY